VLVKQEVGVLPEDIIKKIISEIKWFLWKILFYLN
jgi:hypothetical protein